MIHEDGIHLCPFIGRCELARFSEDSGEAVGETVFDLVLVQRDGKWVNMIVPHRNSCLPALTHKTAAGSAAMSPKDKIQLKENNASHLKLLALGV